MLNSEARCRATIFCSVSPASGRFVCRCSPWYMLRFPATRNYWRPLIRIVRWRELRLPYIDAIFAHHALQHHCYADDTQTYVSAPPSQVQSTALRLQRCIADVADWCRSRRLQLNAVKTELLWFGSSSSLRRLSQSTRAVVVGTEVLQPAESFRDLGVHLDRKLSMQTHVAKVTQICFFQLRRQHQIRRLLGRDVTANFVSALVLTRLDYNNALLAGLPYSTVAPLQRVINVIVRPSTDRRPGRHHRIALAADRRKDTVQTTVSARPPGTSRWTTSSSFCSRSLNCPRVIQVCDQPTRTPCSSHVHHWSLASGRSQCCWSHSLEQTSGRHQDNYQHPSFQELVSFHSTFWHPSL